MVSSFVVVILLSALAFLPSAMRFLFNASSLTGGLLGACAIILGMGMIGLHRFQSGASWSHTILLIVLTIFLIVIHGLVSYLWFPQEIGRSAGSLVVLVIMFITASQTKAILQSVESRVLNRSINAVSIIFIVIAVLSFADIQPSSMIILGKPIFPFTEPSHFALTFAPFLIYRCVRARLPIKLTWLISALVLAYVLKNLSLVVAVGVAALCCLPGAWLVAGLLSVGVVIGSLDVTYFTDRLDFSAQTTNLSTLVYLQGFELMNVALKATSGWGIGFQQLGFAPINAPISDIIYAQLHDDSNLRGGGFVAAKLIAEFGFFGFLLVLWYAWAAARAVLTLRRESSYQIGGEPLRLFALSLIAGFFTEMFVRGVGFFSGTALLLVSALMLAAEARSPRGGAAIGVKPCSA